jgi:hypothetical protein
MSRPRKGSELGECVSLTVWLPVALRAALEAEAAKTGQALAQVVRRLLGAV